MQSPRDDILTVLCDFTCSRFLHKPKHTSSSPLKLSAQQVHCVHDTITSSLEWKVTTGSVHRHRLPLENVVLVRMGFPQELREHAHFFRRQNHVFCLKTTRGKFLVLSAPNARKLDKWVSALRSSLTQQEEEKGKRGKGMGKRHEREPPHTSSNPLSSSSLAGLGKHLFRTSDPLTVAASCGDNRVVERFVDNRRSHRNVYSMDQPSIESALFFAAAGGHVGCVEPLLRISAAFYRHHDGTTVLHAAVRSSNSEVVQMIAQYTFELADEIDDEGNTPVHVAVMSGDRECLRALLQACAETSTENRNGLTPLALARQRRARLKKRRRRRTGGGGGGRAGDRKEEESVLIANDIVKLLKEYGATMRPPPRGRLDGGGGGDGGTDMDRIMVGFFSALLFFLA